MWLGMSAAEYARGWLGLSEAEYARGCLGMSINVETPGDPQPKEDEWVSSREVGGGRERGHAAG
jgi:hypothetical protein